MEPFAEYKYKIIYLLAQYFKATVLVPTVASPNRSLESLESPSSSRVLPVARGGGRRCLSRARQARRAARPPRARAGGSTWPRLARRS
jgi:hypothetical protein